MSWLRGVTFWAYYTAWDTALEVGKTGDKAAHTIKISKDGAAPVTATNNQHATNHVELANGEYALLVTATEATADTINVLGASVTASIVIMPFRTALLRLPNVDPGAGVGLTTFTSVDEAILDAADAIETSLTVRQALRLIAAACAGKVSGMASNAPVFRNVGDTKNRITATTDANGNRTAITTDAT